MNNIDFDEYAIAMLHPVTTEYRDIKKQVEVFVDAVVASDKNYIVVFPNNDLGTDEILKEYKRLHNNKRFKIYPSLRFEYFLRLLKESNFIIGNSSAGVREAPFYNVPTINVGTRQNNRAQAKSIINVSYNSEEISSTIQKIVSNMDKEKDINEFGNGNSNLLFFDLLKSETIWKIDCQKQFQDL